MTKFIEFHIIQSVPANNMNRGEDGTIKTMTYGGATRVRVSSQSLKHAMRKYFKENYQDDSTRTVELPTLLANAIKKQNDKNLTDDEARDLAKEVLKTAGVSVNKDFQTDALLLTGTRQINLLANYALTNDEFNKKELRKLFKEANPFDLALFGRMVASDPNLNVDAASQVAHSFSVNRADLDTDFYTALDDEKPNAGASNLGLVSFSSETLYRYANLNMDTLKENLPKTDLASAVSHFAKSFIYAMPAGKQNSFANKTLPSYILITIRDSMPVNYAPAFEIPISSKTGYTEDAIKVLDDYNNTIEMSLGKPSASFVWQMDGNLDEFVKKLEQEIAND